MSSAVIGSCPVDNIPTSIMERYRRWLDDGHAAGMAYLHNHLDIRKNPHMLLAEVKTVISLAFPYASPIRRNPKLPTIASYALGDDYHDVLRKFLAPFIDRLRLQYGGDYRLCIDSAPIFERHFAEKAGIGSRCDNGLISVPHFGTKVFLAEILSTADISIPPSYAGISEIGECSYTPIPEEDFSKWRCSHCGACRRACPTSALQPDTTVDARRCLSYLTIEHRGDWDEIGKKAMSTPAGRHTLYGCDICQNACPLNRRLHHPSTPPLINSSTHQLINSSTLTLTPSDILDMSQEDFSRIFRHSPIKRTKLAGLQRNARNTLPTNGE